MNILFICTGNTCRSPLAEALMRRELEEREEVPITVGSAGTGALDGTPASEGSYLVGLENGLDLSSHRARQLTRDMVDQTDLVLAMGRNHQLRVEALGGEGKTFLLGTYAGADDEEAEVADPFGADLEEYRTTYRELAQLVSLALQRIIKECRGNE